MPRADHKRLELAKAISAAISMRGDAWVVSIPGADKHLRIELLPGSPLVDFLSSKYQLTSGGKSERIIHNKIEAELFDVKGRLIRKTTNPGIVPVDVYFLELPK